MADSNKSSWQPSEPPDNAPEPPKAHVKRGRPAAVWAYRSAAGKALGYVYRFNTSDGGKETLPLSWCVNAETAAAEWRWMAFAQPRWLYGLDRLAEQPDCPVLIVEGEKCAEAAQAALPGYVCMCWPGGGQAVAKADWTALAGREVIIFPDCDSSKDKRADGEPFFPADKQPGMVAAMAIANALLELDCKVSIVNISGPGIKPSGWDIADEVAAGATTEQLLAIIDNRREVLGKFGKKSARPEAGAMPVITGAGDAWRLELMRKDGRLVDCRENVYLMLKHHPAWANVLWADEFARKIIKRAPAPWDDRGKWRGEVEWSEDEDLKLGLWLAQQEGLLIRSEGNLAGPVGWAAREHGFHPVREYLDALDFDGVKRLRHWTVDFLGLRRSPYAEVSAMYFFVGMVGRVYRPGCAMRNMPILEGKQFLGKSTALRIIGGKWFSDAPLDLNNKDCNLLIQGKLLYEIAELDAFARAELTRVKAFVSMQVDRFRAPYDRVPKDFPRYTVFGGSTNQIEYFKDQTGNTRYWPWNVAQDGRINLEGLEKVRDQLFAEAKVLFLQGQRWWPTQEDQVSLFDVVQQDREITDPWERIVATWLDTITRDKVTVTDVLMECLKIEASKIDSGRQMSTRVGIIMHRLGWIKRRASAGKREYFYYRPDNEEPRASFELQPEDDDDIPY